MSALVATFMWGALSAIFFAAGYYTRDRISRRRRAERLAYSSYGDDWYSHKKTNNERLSLIGKLARLSTQRLRELKRRRIQSGTWEV